MGENGAEGRANTKLFSQCVTAVGWRQRGRIDTNVDCSTCRPTASGTPKTHGVDALFTFPCPVSRQHRGVLIDGKRWSWTTMEGPKKVEATLKKVIEDACHLRVSPDGLKSALGVEEPIVLDTAMLVWHCHDGWRPDTASDWLQKVHPGDYRKPPLLALVATNVQLNRLVQIANFVERHADVEFAYPEANSYENWSKVLTPERLFSRMIPIRYRKLAADPWTLGALYFDIDTPAHIRFLLKYLRVAGFQSQTSFTIWTPCDHNELDGFQSEVDSFLRASGPDRAQPWPGVSTPTVSVMQLVRAEFSS